ncbi:MAG: sigma-70 family RNA polymerase sigma factor [Spirochaetaceae bacterium]
MEKINNKNRARIQEDIWVTYHPKLQVYLKQLFPYITDTQDKVSEILLKVFTKLDQYNPKYAFSTWIYTIARNTQIDEIRKISIQSVDIDDHEIPTDETPETLFMREYDQNTIRHAIGELKSYDRELIYLYYYEEQNYREISEITGVPIGTLKFRMSCSRKKIKSIMERSGKYERQY